MKIDKKFSNKFENGGTPKEGEQSPEEILLIFLT